VIWLAIGLFASVVALLNEGRAARMLWLIAAGYVFVQLWKAPDFDGSEHALFALSWCVIASTILAVGAGSRQAVAISSLTLFSAMCYAVGAILGQPFGLTGPRYLSALFWADIALIVAICVGGWRGVARIGASVASVGQVVSLGRIRFGSRVLGRSGGQASEKASVR